MSSHGEKKASEDRFSGTVARALPPSRLPDLILEWREGVGTRQEIHKHSAPGAHLRDNHIFRMRQEATLLEETPVLSGLHSI